MKVYRDIDQGTKEWHQLRWGQVGGTRSAGLFIDSDTLMLDLVAERTEQWEDDGGFQSYDMIRGQELEPVAIKEIESTLGINLPPAGWISSDIEGFGVSPDGLSDCETIACEVKCLSRKEHVKLCLDGDIPKKYIHQCLHYFSVNPNLKRLIFCAFRPESEIRPMFIKELYRDSIIDLGQTEKTKVKEDCGLGLKEYVATVPVLKTVDEWVKISRDAMKVMNVKVEHTIDQLKF